MVLGTKKQILFTVLGLDLSRSVLTIEKASSVRRNCTIKSQRLLMSFISFTCEFDILYLRFSSLLLMSFISSVREFNLFYLGLYFTSFISSSIPEFHLFYVRFSSLLLVSFISSIREFYYIVFPFYFSARHQNEDLTQNGRVT